MKTSKNVIEKKLITLRLLLVIEVGCGCVDEVCFAEGAVFLNLLLL
jgi:hypothetical protein